MALVMWQLRCHDDGKRTPLSSVMVSGPQASSAWEGLSGGLADILILVDNTPRCCDV